MNCNRIAERIEGVPVLCGTLLPTPACGYVPTYCQACTDAAVLLAEIAFNNYEQAAGLSRLR